MHQQKKSGAFSIVLALYHSNCEILVEPSMFAALKEKVLKRHKRRGFFCIIFCNIDILYLLSFLLLSVVLHWESFALFLFSYLYQVCSRCLICKFQEKFAAIKTLNNRTKCLWIKILNNHGMEYSCRKVMFSMTSTVFGYYYLKGIFPKKLNSNSIATLRGLL